MTIVTDHDTSFCPLLDSPNRQCWIRSTPSLARISTPSININYPGHSRVREPPQDIALPGGSYAEQGDPEAQHNLGFMYSHGEGVPENDVLAYMWYNLAGALFASDEDAQRSQQGKDFVEQQMTREQIAEAQRLSTEWMAAHPSGGNYPPSAGVTPPYAKVGAMGEPAF